MASSEDENAATHAFMEQIEFSLRQFPMWNVGKITIVALLFVSFSIHQHANEYTNTSSVDNCLVESLIFL